MRSGRVLLALAALAALGACVHGEAVVKLTEANFDELVGVGTDPQAPHFIEFFAPWCGHCKKLAPAWEELAQKLADEGHPTVIGAVDATIHKNLAVRFGVRGFPTLILVTDGKMFKYKGSRAVEDLEAFVKGGYKSSEGEPAPQQQTKLGKLAQQVVELFDSIVTLFKTQFAAALVMTALAFFTGLTIGFAGGLVLAPGAPKAPRRTPPPPPAAEPAINADSAKKHE